MGKIHHHHRRSCLLPFLFPIPHFHSRPAHTSLPGRTYIRLSGKGILPVENFHVHRIILFRHNGGAYCVPCNVHRSPCHIQDPVNPHNQPIASTGSPTELKTMDKVIRPTLGTPAVPMEASVAVAITVRKSAADR